jgi:hypothetical protein
VPAGSLKIEFRFLNGNLVARGNPRVYFRLSERTPRVHVMITPAGFPKALSVIALAILLGSIGAAMADDNGKNPRGRPAPAGLPAIMIPARARTLWRAEDAFAKYSVQHHFVKSHVEK